MDGWIKDATTSLIAFFAAGFRENRPAVQAAKRFRWSNGRPKGISAISTLAKPQVYSRAKIVPIEARLGRSARTL